MRLLAAALLLIDAVARAAPFVPADDAEVLERLPIAAADPRARTLAELRAQLRRDPTDAAAAAALAQRYVELAGEDGDPRFVGYAQAALQPWWQQPAAPPEVRVMRAVVLQYGHHFDAALADLDAVVADDPQAADAWAWRAAIHMVRADYAHARTACTTLADLVEPLIAAACTAYVDSMTGRATVAAQSLRAALARDTQAEPAQRLWALTRLAEIEERRGAAAAAESAFRAALALGRRDVYLLAAYADFLLDERRPAEVLTLLRDGVRADVLLLRLSIAARATGDARAAAWTRELEARFDATRARGDTTHRKEEARFALELAGQPQRALQLAGENFAEQREAADARILMQAALAAGRPEAAAPALQWLRANHVESARLQPLAERLVAAPPRSSAPGGR